MTEKTPSHEIQSRLKIVRGRIRAAQLKRAAWVTATVALGGLLLIMAADWLLAPLPAAARWVLCGGWWIGMGFTMKNVGAPLLKKVGLIQIARWIESRHPEMEERLSTVLELSENAGEVSPELFAALGKAAAEDIAQVDPQGEVRSAQTKMRWAKPAAALAALLLISLVVWPREASRLLVRAVAPFSRIGNAGAVKFKIEPGNLEVMQGDRIELKILYNGDAEKIGLRIRLDGEKEISQSLSRERNQFRYVLDPARKSFQYRAQAGRAQSDLYTAKVWPLPALIEPRVTLEFQKYTGLLKREEPLGEGIETVEGTMVSLRGRLNTPLGEGWLEIDGKRITAAEIGKSAAGDDVDFSWKLAGEGAGEAVVKFRNKLGREVEALHFPVRILADQKPQVVIVSPAQKDLKVRPDELLHLRYEVTEDFSLAKTAVEAGADPDRTATIDQALPIAINGSGPLRFQGSAAIAIGQLRTRFPGANELKLRVRAEDGRPADLGGPGIGNSEWLTVHIDQNAESLARQELRAEHDGARQTIEKAIQEVRQARDQMEGLREQAKQETMDENAARRLEETADKLTNAQNEIAGLAREMEEAIHAAKADDVQKAAADLEKSREALENSPLQDKQESREAKWNEARQAAEDAGKQLEKVRDAMDRDREKIEDLTRIQELAQQQQELARQAAENLENPPQSPQDWQARQKQMEEALRQQLRERPDAKAQALKAQAEAAKAMAQQAREISAAQKNLQEQSAGQPQQAAGALEDLAKGAPPKAWQDSRKTQAEAAAKLAAEIQQTPLAEGSGHWNEAANTAQQGSQQAQAADQQSEAGQPQQAAADHAQAAQNFHKSAAALDRSAEEFSHAAQQAAAQQANSQKAALPAADLARAFQKAGEAATSQGAEAALRSAQAAAALAQAAQAGRQQMRGNPQPGKPGPPGQPGQNPEEGLQARQADPGVPPELAKLGITAADWEKIQATLSSSVGAGGADGVPQEYRGLVKDYFESISKKGE